MFRIFTIRFWEFRSGGFEMNNSQKEMYCSQHPLVRYGHNKRANEVVEMVVRANPKRVLEIGCGEGFCWKSFQRSAMLNCLEQRFHRKEFC